MSFWRVGKDEIRVQLVLLAAVLWTYAVALLALPGARTFIGPVKGGDFLEFYVLGTVAREARFDALYDHQALHALQVGLVPESASEYYLTPYPPHASLLFAPLSALPYLPAYFVWITIVSAAYGAMLCWSWRRCQCLRRDGSLVLVAALAFVPFWQLVMHGQVTIVPMAALVGAWAALEKGHHFGAGMVLGFLALKPQLGLAVALLAIARCEWALVFGAVLSLFAQGFLVSAIMGVGIWRDYLNFLSGLPSVIQVLQPMPYQMHSLRGLFDLFLPRPAVEGFWLLATGGVLVMLVRAWRADSVSLKLRMALLMIATVLVSPHLFIYDCTLLAPALMVACDWALSQSPGGKARRITLAGVYFLFLAYLIPTARLLPIQPSVLLLLTVFGTVGLMHGGNRECPIGASTG